jgi:hypothetical protein
MNPRSCRWLIVSTLLIAAPGVISAEKRPPDPSDFTLSAEVKEVTPTPGNSCEIEAVIRNVLYGLGNTSGQGCPFGVGTYDHVRWTKSGFDFLLYDTKKQIQVVKHFYVVGEHALPEQVITAYGIPPQQNAKPASDQEAFPVELCGKPPALDEKSVAAFENQAAQGDTAAQCGMGLSYYTGQGVSRDYLQAAGWFRKAAEKDNPMAQYLLGTMYLLGEGVPQDFAEAYFWVDVAAVGKLDAADAASAAKSRDDTASLLTPADLSREQERARKWFEAHQEKPQ